MKAPGFDRTWIDRYRSPLLALADLAVFLLLWQLAVVQFGLVDRIFVSAPAEVWTALRDLWSAGELQNALTTSARSWVAGYGSGVVVGVALGLVVGAVRAVHKLVMPLLWSLWATPLIALQPMLTVWFGYDSGPIIVLVFLSTFIPVALNTVVGSAAVGPSLLEAGRVFGGGRLALYRKVRLPWTVPYMIGGMRLAVPTSFIGLLVGEMVGSPSGVGALITNGTARFQTAQAFAGIGLYVAVSVALVRLIDLAERRVGRWRGEA